MAASVQIPDQAAQYLLELQNLLATSEAQVWAASLGFCIGSLEMGYVASAQACLDKLASEFAIYLDPRARRIINSAIAGLGDLVSDLQFIYSEVGAGELAAAEAIDGLLELGLVYQGAATPPALETFIAPYLQLSQTFPGNGPGGTHVAQAAVAPIPVVSGTTCGTGKATAKGICCQAVTQLGLARAAQGFQYTDCNGKVRCLACGTKASTSKKNPGATVFSVKRVTCGPSGCPALGQVQGNIIQPI